MALTKEKEFLMNRLNEEARKAYEEARDKAVQSGRPLPTPPAPLEPVHLEYPKFLYNSSGEAKLVRDAGEHKSVGAGWGEAPPKKE